jgi:pimeloyl-ACP methyl ester carboxylesterase
LARFLLIHGSWHGAWCWRDVLPLLRELGHEAEAIDLPGHGEDHTPAGEVTLQGYADAVVSAMRPGTILVGHSMGGYPITAAAERAAKRISRLVYLAAYVPLSGRSLAEMRQRGPRQPLLDAMVKSEDGVTVGLDPDQIEAKFYHDCPKGILDYARKRLTPQPIKPTETPLDVTERSAAIPATYIVCEDDRAVPPEYQGEMANRVDKRHSLSCGHSPFFAVPAELVDLLNRIAEEEP